MRARPLAASVVATILATVVIGCPSRPPAPTTATKATPAPPAPAPPIVSPSTWTPSLDEKWNALATFDAGSGATLLVGEHGERWLDRGDAKPTGSPWLAPGELRGVMRAGTGLAFVRDDGAVYLAPDALGPFQTMHAPPDVMRSIGVGHAAIVAVDSSFALVRSTDFGLTWSATNAPLLAATPWKVAMNASGAGLVLAFPQRVLVTLDDGAHWDPIATPGFGARDLVVDETGTIFLYGSDFSAGPAQLVLGASPTLRVTGTYPKDFPRHVPSEGTPAPRVARVIDGARVIETTATKIDGGLTWNIGIGNLGDAIVRRHVPNFDACDGLHVVAHEGVLGAICTRGTQTTTPVVFRSSDGGANWTEDLTLETSHANDGAPRILVGHGGWTFIDARCVTDDAGKRRCLPPRVRPAGEGAPRDVTFDGVPADNGPAKMEIGAITLRGEEAWMIVSMGDARRVFHLGAKGSDLTSALDLGAGGSYDRLELSVDEEKTIRVLRHAHDTNTWTMTERAASGAERTWSIPMSLRWARLSGARGFAVESNGGAHAWETADGGHVWIEVGAPGAIDENGTCGDYGCVFGARARVGWDLPALASTAKRTVVDAPSPPSPPEPKYATPLHCVVDGPWKKAPSSTAFVRDKDGGVSVSIPRPDGKGVDVVKMLAAPAVKGVRLARTMIGVREGGVVAYRYVFDPPSDNDADPRVHPDVEIAWWSTATRKLRRVKIARRPSLEVPPPYDFDQISFNDAEGTYTDPAAIAVDGSSLYYRPAETTPFYRVRADGSIDELAWPGSGNRWALQRAGATWRIATSPAPAPYELRTYWSNDEGATWIARLWTLAPSDLPPFEVGDVRDGLPQLPMVQMNQPLVLADGRSTMATTWSPDLAARYVSAAVVLNDLADPDAIVALPTQTTLGDPPRACDASMLDAPTIVVPWSKGQRHPVIVDGLDPRADDALGFDPPPTTTVTIALATAEARVHVAGARSCVESYEAYAAAVAREEGPFFDRYVSAKIVIGDLAHARLFRGGQVRGMRCAFEAAQLPERLRGEYGFEE